MSLTPSTKNIPGFRAGHTYSYTTHTRIEGKFLGEVLKPWFADTHALATLVERIRSSFGLQASDWRALADGFPRLIQGNSQVLSTTFTPLWSKDARIEGVMVVAEDVTEIEKLRAEAISSSRLVALGEMAAGIAHEINSPNAIIQGRARHIQKFATKPEPDMESITRFAREIFQTSERISKIIKGLKRVTRLGVSDPLEAVSLHDLIGETLELCKDKFQMAGVKLIVEEFSGLRPVSARPSELSQVLLNLLNNAFDAMQGLPDPWIRIGATQNAEETTLKITDAGLGIPPEIAEKIMQPFFTTKEVGKGTGLGLSISRKIIADLGGALSLDRSSEHTCFTITLPTPPRNEVHPAA